MRVAFVAAFVFASAMAIAQTTEARDKVKLSGGREVEGRIVRVGEDEIVLRTGSVDRVIPRKQIESFSSVADRHRELMKEWRDARPEDADAMMALAQRAADRGLPHEARLFRWYAALARPDDPQIHATLGNRDRRGSFEVQIHDRWVPFAKADALGEDFADAWRLRSEHFEMQCSAGLRAGLDSLMDLEALYHAMHDLFGRELSLFELVEPVDVRLYRSQQQMPALSGTVLAYFNADEHALYTFFENGRAQALMHEGTHALLHFFFVRAAKSRGSLPAWLDEGWAEYMDARLQQRVPGKPTLLEKSVNAAHFATLAQAKKADDLYGVHRLLNFKTGDFLASSRQSTKYAQAWALFRYLFEHGEAALRKQFFEYLREAAAGQGQASTFRRIFARQEQELEREPWHP